MAREIPSAPRVYTTTYDNFKGVDFTNDSTNVWRRRSPTGVNMLPDASGRPFKRHGWDILITQKDLCYALSWTSFAVDQVTWEADPTLYYTYDEDNDVFVQCDGGDSYDADATYYQPNGEAVADCTINKLAYFELAGVDHIVIFTDRGVLFYNGDENATDYYLVGITAVNREDECYGNYDRNFFFEGDGTSAFYIYGNYRMWRYGVGFTLEEITEQLTIPRVIVSATADGIGETYEAYNLLYNMASVEYREYDLFTYWGKKGLVFSIDDDTFKSNQTQCNPSYYKWECTDISTTPPTWTWKGGGTSIALDASITPEDPKVGDQIVVLYTKGLMLPNNIDLNNQGDLVKAYASVGLQFDLELTRQEDYDNLASHEFYIHTDDVERDNPQSWIEFYSGDTYEVGSGTKFAGMDTFKTIFPSTQIVVTEYSDDKSTAITDTGEAVLVGDTP